MTSDEPDAPSVLADLTGSPRERFEYTGKICDRSGIEPAPIEDWEQESAWNDHDTCELEDDGDED